VLSGRSKFKRVRHFVALGTLAVLAGCATTPPGPGTAPRAVRTGTQPLDRMQVAIVPPERDLQAQLMAGDFALAANDLKAASDAYGRAAPLTDDPRVAARATELALAVHDQDAAARGLANAPSLRGIGSKGQSYLGLPADFLIGTDGTILAANYGKYTDDHWPVDELLALARGERTSR